MDEAEAYVKRASKARYQHFRGGYASMKQKPPLGSSNSTAAPGHQTLSQPQGVLPPKKGRKRLRSPDATAETPASVVTLSTSEKRRISLIDKWFPGNTLKQATVETCHAPPEALVAATVQRITKAREAMILLRSGVEDVEAVVAELSRSNTASATTTPSLLKSGDIKRIVTRATAPGIGEAFAQFAKEQGHGVGFVRAQVRELMRRRAKAHACVAHSVKEWHAFLNEHGPESGKAPTTRNFVWLSSASITTLFTVLVQRFLRGVRECATVASGEKAAQPRGMQEEDGELEGKRAVLDINDPEEDLAAGDDGDAQSARAPLQPGNSADNVGERRNKCWLEATQRALVHSAESRGNEPAPGDPASKSQCQLLVFLRFFMPTTEEGCSGREARRSSGYGAWLLACLACLDTPLDPDTDRLVHDLFRTCCDQVRVIGEWRGMHGEQRGMLLDALRQEEDALVIDKSSVPPKTYSSFNDAGKAELLALYTVIIILAKLFRQNQNRLIPL